jgi:hypothetical protein
MSTAIITPKRVREFSGRLRESLKRIRAATKQFKSSAEIAGGVWADEKHFRFVTKVRDCTGNADRFCAVGAKYADYLDEKAARAQRYLDRR